MRGEIFGTKLGDGATFVDRGRQPDAGAVVGDGAGAIAIFDLGIGLEAKGTAILGGTIALALVLDPRLVLAGGVWTEGDAALPFFWRLPDSLPDCCAMLLVARTAFNRWISVSELSIISTSLLSGKFIKLAGVAAAASEAEAALAGFAAS